MRYEAELIYVTSHEMLAGSDTHLGGGSTGVCVCVCACVFRHMGVDGCFLQKMNGVGWTFDLGSCSPEK